MNLAERVVRGVSAPAALFSIPSISVAKTDVDNMFQGLELHKVSRYFMQKYWKEETNDHVYAKKLEKGLRLESVSEHSWHVADTVLLIAPLFSKLSLGKCISLAIIHDKLELYTGDLDPVGKSGNGEDTHAFSSSKRKEKIRKEKLALNKYLHSLNNLAKQQQKKLFYEYISNSSYESKFVSALDKLQAFCYVINKKNGIFENDHIFFTMKYSRKAIASFPALINHYYVLLDMFIESIACRRNISRDQLEYELFSQYEFDFN